MHDLSAQQQLSLLRLSTSATDRCIHQTTLTVCLTVSWAGACRLSNETHAVAQRKQEQMEKLRAALNLPKEVSQQRCLMYSQRQFFGTNSQPHMHALAFSSNAGKGWWPGSTIPRAAGEPARGSTASQPALSLSWNHAGAAFCMQCGCRHLLMPCCLVIVAATGTRSCGGRPLILRPRHARRLSALRSARQRKRRHTSAVKRESNPPGMQQQQQQPRLGVRGGCAWPLSGFGANHWSVNFSVFCSSSVELTVSGAHVAAMI